MAKREGDKEDFEADAPGIEGMLSGKNPVEESIVTQIMMARDQQNVGTGIHDTLRSERPANLPRQPGRRAAGIDPTAMAGETDAPLRQPPEKTPTLFEEARAAGFSESEIGEWAATQRADWRAAGFTDQEIDQELTGMKNPRQVPRSFLQRFGEGFMGEPELTPMQEAIREGAKAGFGEAPLGPPPEDIQRLRESQIGLSVRDEYIIKGVYTGAQVAFRGLNAALTATGAAIGEAVSEVTGASETESARARRDMAQFVNISAIILGAYAGRPGYGAYPGEVHTVGPKPSSQDFTDATKVVTGLKPIELTPEQSTALADVQRRRTTLQNYLDKIDSVQANKHGQTYESPEFKAWQKEHHEITAKLSELAAEEDRINPEGKRKREGGAGEVKPEVRDTIAKLYEDHGIHPAEVANDAQTDPAVAQSIAKGEVPARYAPPETISMAALRSPKDGTIFTGINHGEAFAEAAKQGKAGNATEEGFLTSTGRFVSREEALAVAERADQAVTESQIGRPDRLTAEQVLNPAKREAPPVERPAVEPEILPPEGKEAPPPSEADLTTLTNKELGDISATAIDATVSEDGRARLMLTGPETEALKKSGIAIDEDGMVSAVDREAILQERDRRNASPVVEEVTPDGIDTRQYLPATTTDDMIPRMGGGGEDGGGPPPGGLGAPAIPPERRPPFFTYDDRPGWQKIYSGILDGWRNTFQPELVSDAALRADPLFARYKSRQGAGHDRALNAAEEYRQFWRTVPEADRLRYMYDFERGNFIIEVEQKPDFFQRVVGRGEEAWQQIAQRHTDLLGAAYKMEEEAGSKAGYIQDYFPHIWEKPEQARAYVEGKTAQLGPTWFQKSRTFDLIKDGMEAGLRLKTTNPEDLITMRLLSSADMVERIKLLGDLKDMNLAVKAKGSDPMLPHEGWQTINGPDREQWLIAPDVQPLWKNAVEAKGLWANEGAPGTAFRGWMALKNVWVPVKLALSLFHPLHVLHINYTEGFARAWGQIVKGGDPLGALQSAVEGIVEPIGTAIPGVPTLGKKARAAWLKPPEEWTAPEKAAMSLMHDGGFVPELSQQLKINGKRALQDAIDNSQWVRTIPLGLRRAIEIVQAPVFQEWIPNLKASAYLKDAQALLDRRPELLDNHEQRGVALRTIAKSIDNRFGEMNYGALFWNRIVKDMGIGSFLSLGWNLGFAREFGGSLLGPVARTVRRLDHGETVSEATIRDAQSKLSFVVPYVASAMGINAMMTYLFTGEGPQDILDYILPRIGGRNPDGSPRRITNMFYTREIPMAIKHTQEEGGGVAGTIKGLGDMLWSKLMFQPIKEIMENKSYYGSDIWDVNGPVYQQAGQAIAHIFGEQFNPMSISGAIRSQQTGGQPWEMGLAALGFGPAPSYASKTGMQNRIAFLFQRHVAPMARPAEMGEQAKERQTIRTDVLMAQRAGDQPKLRDAVDRWFAAGGSNQGLSNIINKLGGDVSMFRALPEPDQRALMENATPEEKARYGPWQKSNITNTTADLIVEAQKARSSGDVQRANELERRMTDGVLHAAKEGHITDKAAFDRSVKQRLIMHYQPDLGAVLNLPKSMRATGPPGATPPIPQPGTPAQGTPQERFPQINMAPPTSPLRTPAGLPVTPHLGTRG